MSARRFTKCTSARCLLKMVMRFSLDLKGLHFSESDIAYLRETGEFDEDFMDYLKDWRFKATVRAPREGEVVFNNEPILQVEGSVFDAQLVETPLLNIVNYQTLIATKASRIRSVVGDQTLMEFGTRRAQEMDAALWGTRAAYIGGFNATSNVRAGKLFGIPISGTHAHSLVQVYRNDYEAFKAYAETHKDVVFLVDTYDTLRSGVPSAIRVAKEMGDKINFIGVRIDSGAYDQPALGGVYKVVSVENENGEMVDTIKISGTAEKISNPGKKQVWRITRNSDGKSQGDYVALWDEDPRELPDGLYMFHPNYPYLNKTVVDYTARPILQDIFVDGELVYDLPALNDIREYTAEHIESLWSEYRRDLNPQEYPVDLSQAAWDHKMNLIKELREYVSEVAKEYEEN